MLEVFVSERRFFVQALRMPPRIPERSNQRFEEHYFHNQRLHFTICFSKKAANDVSYDTSITVINEDEERFKNDFKPDEETMKILLKYVLDCHPKFIGEDDDEDLNMKVASLKPMK